MFMTRAKNMLRTKLYDGPNARLLEKTRSIPEPMFSILAAMMKVSNNPNGLVRPVAFLTKTSLLNFLQEAKQRSDAIYRFAHAAIYHYFLSLPVRVERLFSANQCI